ncbi:TetR/AcrR family transcriptional regulator [Mycolicibacterium sp. CBMA 234]|uniref:TetR/AcrR family transcriptional regulator n=1 Tax=Mycolicibacterium sp. CBMA 234 TaxID=1918495 RepID=UPI0012DC890E|nr:TetR/AcrR family transcriptional regulator [Mycolicibacterium sp. CBMA 234]
MTDTATDVAVDDVELARATFALLAGVGAEPLPRHRHQLSRGDVRRSQTARILAAAIELFGDEGYAETTVAQIADRAGVSRRTVYDLYDSKEAVFLHTYRCTQLLMMKGAWPADRTPDEPALTVAELPRIVRGLLEFIAAAPAAMRMFFLEAPGAGPRVRARRNEAIAEFVSVIAPALQRLRATAEPALPPLSVDLCNAIVAAAIELIVQHLGRSEPESLTDIAPAMADLIRAVVTPNCAP